MFNNDLINLMFDNEWFDWDKKFYRFNRDEKDMRPYSIYHKDKKIIITHNILGVNKEDLKISRENENNTTYIVIEGKTKDDVTGKEYSISSRLAADDKNLDLEKIQAQAKNGLLYITIPEKEQKKIAQKNIEVK